MKLLTHISEWAFGFNRQIGSVSSVARNFGFQTSSPDRFAIKQETDQFGFGFVGSVIRFHPKLADKKKLERRIEENAAACSHDTCSALALAPQL